MINTPPKHILISRTDAIGDVVLTLPMCGYIKEKLPDVEISFLGRSYTEAVINACSAIDHFINYDELLRDSYTQRISFLRKSQIDTFIHVYPDKNLGLLAAISGIPNRIGTNNRISHWFSCNNFITLSRKNSDLHEAQLNLMLLQGIGIHELPGIQEIPQYYNLTKIPVLEDRYRELLSPDKFNLILHPKSRGSAREWRLDKYSELISNIDKNRFRIFVSGTYKEKPLLTAWLKQHSNDVTDIVGALSLNQFIAFIKHADGLLAASTGPLHIAAALGIYSLGLYSNSRPIHAGRWHPIGTKSQWVEEHEHKHKSHWLHIAAEEIASIVNEWEK
ncbi:glycosyltransferase family 9 protein (plasmid) [Pedobacter sp. BS3]|uniref:glycosyltransferase family 9 protein n=1 Tax=Pedobacter sp. BS3 TaxID=2567937 RepID=UPI0011EFC7C3|nr:glycosyltransferase family 9 protein [Pedobacter sp. BS3]TZF86018.1 glycosyltransferase family 9 protein [Pedobacter sp. BS3]